MRLKYAAPPGAEGVFSRTLILHKAGYEALRDGKTGSSLKFKANVGNFHPEGKEAASVRQIMTRVTGATYQLVYFPRSKFNPPVGHIKIWCSPHQAE